MGFCLQNILNPVTKAFYAMNTSHNSLNALSLARIEHKKYTFKIGFNSNFVNRVLVSKIHFDKQVTLRLNNISNSLLKIEVLKVNK